MAFQAVLTDELEAGTRRTLQLYDVLYVKEGVTLARTDGFGGNAIVLAAAGQNYFDIRGSILGIATGIVAGDKADSDSGYRFDIASTGEIRSWDGSGITVNGVLSDITNHGTIEGSQCGVMMNGINSSTTSKIVNTGTIKGATYGIDPTQVVLLGDSAGAGRRAERVSGPRRRAS